MNCDLICFTNVFINVNFNLLYLEYNFKIKQISKLDLFINIYNIKIISFERIESEKKK